MNGPSFLRKASICYCPVVMFLFFSEKIRAPIPQKNEVLVTEQPVYGGKSRISLLAEFFFVIHGGVESITVFRQSLIVVLQFSNLIKTRVVHVNCIVSLSEIFCI